MDPTEKLLRAVARIRQTEAGRPVKQEALVCRTCGMTVDVTDPNISVDFRDVQVNGEPFMVADADCPRCLKKIQGQQYVVN